MRGGNEGEALYRRPDPVARGGGDRPPLSPAGGATGPPGGPTGLSPLGGATGACRPLGGDRRLSREFNCSTVLS